MRILQRATKKMLRHPHAQVRGPEAIVYNPEACSIAPGQTALLPLTAMEARIWTVRMPNILFDARWIGNHGIGRFAAELQKQLPELEAFQARRRPWHPLDPVLLAAALRQRKPRLFFSPGYNSPLGWPGTFVFSLHDLNHLRVLDNSNAAKRAYYRMIIKPACHRAAFVLTVSEYSRQEICAWAEVGEERIVNVGNGVGLPFVAQGRKHEPGYPYFLYVGSHKVHKNLPRLLKAYAISGVGRHIRLVLTGTPDAGMLSLTKELDLEKSVTFIGFPNNDDLSAYYRGSVALVFPSLYEGFGLPPVEAMACGTPVLTSNVCAMPEIVGDAGILVDPTDLEAIADGIRSLAEDPSLLAALRHKGLARARRFTWEETGVKTRDVLEAALADAKLSPLRCSKS
jgi:glycosyltransferase involved in cell wall biosynthesis